MVNLGQTILQPVLSLGQDKRFPMLIALVIIVLLAQSLAQLTWKVLPAPQLNDTALLANAMPAAIIRTTQSRNQFQAISQWHLFGEVEKSVPKAVTQVENAPDTRLKLKLSGVLASANPLFARAIIGDNQGAEKAYAVGDELPGNAILREIHADRVILETRGRLETLRLPKERPANGAVRQPGASRTSVNGSGGLDTATAEPSALLAQYREALVNDPESLMSLVRAFPVQDKATGKTKGFRISPGKDRALLGRFGLRSGDVVTAVNGVSLDNPIKALEVMRDLATATSVNLSVERNGELRTFTFNVE